MNEIIISRKKSSCSRKDLSNVCTFELTDNEKIEIFKKAPSVHSSGSINITEENICWFTFINVISSSFGLLCFSFLETLNLIFIGYTKNGENNMASIGLGNIFLNFFGVFLGFGMLGGLDTMGSFCFGLKKYQEVGLYTLRTRINLFILFLVMIIPCYFSQSIISCINKDNEVNLNSSIYIWYMMPAVFSTFNLNLNIRYLQVNQVYAFPMIFILIGLIFHFICCYVFIFLLDLEILGICFAAFTTISLMLIATTIYIFLQENKKFKLSLFLCHPEVFNKFWEYFNFCVFSGIQHYSDYIGFEIVTALGAFLPTNYFIANVCALNYSTALSVIYGGYSFPLTHFVGYFIGKDDIKMYYSVNKLFFKIFTISALIMFSFTFLFSLEIACLYSQNNEVREIISILLKIWSIGIICDHSYMMLQGVLKGFGKQKIISVWNIIVVVIFMIPSSYIFCFYFNFGVYGLMFSCVLYGVLLTAVGLIYLFKIDLNEVSKQLNHEMNEDEIPLIET